MNTSGDGVFKNNTELVDPFLGTTNPVTSWNPITFMTYNLTDPLTTERENSEVFKSVIPTGWDLITMATICTNVSCKKAIIHFNETAQAGEDMTGKDASWILTSAVIIFTMQTGERQNYFSKVLANSPVHLCKATCLALRSQGSSKGTLCYLLNTKV